MSLDPRSPSLYTFFVCKQRGTPMTKAAESRIPSSTRTRTTSGPVASADQIAQRAHEIFIARGSAHGRDLDDWLQAEQELQRPNGRRKKK
jgi:hypothetical protein